MIDFHNLFIHLMELAHQRRYHLELSLQREQKLAQAVAAALEEDTAGEFVAWARVIEANEQTTDDQRHLASVILSQVEAPRDPR